MPLTKPLFKTTVVIWSEYNPEFRVSLADLARDADTGESYCASMTTEEIAEPEKDPAWDGTEFFGVSDDEEAAQ